MFPNLSTRASNNDLFSDNATEEDEVSPITCHQLEENRADHTDPDSSLIADFQVITDLRVSDLNKYKYFGVMCKSLVVYLLLIWSIFKTYDHIKLDYNYGHYMVLFLDPEIWRHVTHPLSKVFFHGAT